MSDVAIILHDHDPLIQEDTPCRIGSWACDGCGKTVPADAVHVHLRFAGQDYGTKGACSEGCAIVVKGALDAAKTAG